MIIDLGNDILQRAHAFGEGMNLSLLPIQLWLRRIRTDGVLLSG